MAPNGHVTAIDLSEAMIQKCKEDLNGTGLQNITFVVCGLNDIAYENEFDIIFSNSVLHWVIDIEDALLRMYIALRPGGQIAVQFPLLNKHHPLVMYADRVIDKMHLQQYYRGWTFPWYAPTEQSFRNTLAKVNFKKISIKKKITDFEFESANAVFDHFQSVGLKLYTDVLPGKQKEQFMDAVLQEIRNDSAGKMILHYERLFAHGEK
jgi:trans-aconitate methyltransferase